MTQQTCAATCAGKSAAAATEGVVRAAAGVAVSGAGVVAVLMVTRAARAVDAGAGCKEEQE